MKIADIVSALPRDWTERGNCRAPKRLSNREKRELLDPYQVGMMRLADMYVAICNLTEADIVLLGRCSIDRVKVLVGKVCNDWHIVTGKAPEGFRAYYVVKGKKVLQLHKHKSGTIDEILQAYECEDTTKPLAFMKADEIFAACKGKRFRKKPGDLARKEYCEKRGESVVVETRHKPKRGERVHMRALIRKSKTTITWNGL